MKMQRIDQFDGTLMEDINNKLIKKFFGFMIWGITACALYPYSRADIFIDDFQGYWLH